jgi:superfamily II DNA/RNA helicase
MRIFSVRCIGGNGISGQIRNIRIGFNFIIGTPGRLKDLMDRRILNMAVFQNIVLDEVDRMLDMGFVDEIRNIISLLPKEKQSLFFSATVDTKIDALIKTILKPDYKKVSVVQGSTSQNINQDVVYFKDYEEKQTKLKDLVQSKINQRVLVFVNTKREVDRLDKMLYESKFSVDSIHGDKRQTMRKRAIDNFKAGQTDILIATDVAARGLDIPKVALVINYDVPNNYQDYIHRIGRTGRANEIGDALTFVRKSV